MRKNKNVQGPVLSLAMRCCGNLLHFIIGDTMRLLRCVVIVCDASQRIEKRIATHHKRSPRIATIASYRQL
jgi:hypothetical protein